MPQPADSLWTRVICKQPGRYIGWPSIARTSTGELLVVFSGDRDVHVCPWGKTHLVRGSDDGETWSAAQIIHDSPLDDRDAGIIETAKGTLLASWITTAEFAAEPDYRKEGAAVTRETRDRWVGSWVQRSADGGGTWQEPIRVASFAPHGPVQLSDGRLLYLGNDTGDVNVIAEESTDDGRTWTVIGSVSHAPETAHRGLGVWSLMTASSFSRPATTAATRGRRPAPHPCADFRRTGFACRTIACWSSTACGCPRTGSVPASVPTGARPGMWRMSGFWRRHRTPTWVIRLRRSWPTVRL
jgi:hypothetical protein